MKSEEMAEVWSETLESLKQDPQSDARDRALQEMESVDGEIAWEPSAHQNLLVIWAKVVVRLPDECLVGLTGQSLSGEIRILAKRWGVLNGGERDELSPRAMKTYLEDAVTSLERSAFMERLEAAISCLDAADTCRHTAYASKYGLSTIGRPDASASLRVIAEVADSMWQHAV